MAIINFIAEVALFADADCSVELFALWGDFRADFVIVEDVVGGTLGAVTINPSFAAKIIIEGSEEGKIAVFDGGA